MFLNGGWIKPEWTGRVVLALRGGPDAVLGDGDGLPLLLLLQVQAAARLGVVSKKLGPGQASWALGLVILVTFLLSEETSWSQMCSCNSPCL